MHVRRSFFDSNLLAFNHRACADNFNCWHARAGGKPHRRPRSQVPRAAPVIARRGSVNGKHGALADARRMRVQNGRIPAARHRERLGRRCALYIVRRGLRFRLLLVYQRLAAQLAGSKYGAVNKRVRI